MMMSARLLLEVTLRVLGLWSLYTAIGNVATYVSFLWDSTTPGLSQWLAPIVVGFVVQCILGITLIWWAPWIAARFYPAAANEAVVHLNVGAGDVYRVACFVLGVYLLVGTAQPASRFVAAAMAGPSSWSRPQIISDAVATLVYAAAGIVLVFRSEGIGRFLSSLRYDPDRIPKPQFTLLMLLLLMLFVGVVLAVIRMLTPGSP